MTFIDTSDLPAREPREGWRGRLFHSQNMSFAYYEVSAGAWIHEHHHPNEEVWNFIDGRFEVSLDGQTHVAEPGCAAVVPPNAPHAIKALTEGRALVVDYPVRR